MASSDVFTRDGGRWGVGQLHRLLTRPTYIGRHEFNKRSKAKQIKPAAEVIPVEVPPLIDRATFDAVQAHLKSRNPKVTPARVVSGPTLLTGICFCAGCGGAMTIRTGKGGGRYRYYTCSIAARQGATGCAGRSIPMEKLDDLVAGHLERRLLDPERLEEILATVLDRRQERADRRRIHIAELNKQAAEADAQRASQAVEGAGATITPAHVAAFARKARERIRLPGGGYRRDHLRALAQRVEVADREVRIMGSKGELLRTPTAAAGVKSAAPGVPSSVPNWRRGCPPKIDPQNSARIRNA
jgi:ribosomal protein L18E